jgi:predicted O-methyltransferase YrrM
MTFDVAIVNYNTDCHLLRLIRSVATVVPSRHLAAVHVWDNASTDSSREVLEALAREFPWLHPHFSRTNIHHGPALDILLREACTAPWVLILDADTEVLRDFVPHLPALDAGTVALVGQVSPWAAPLYFYLAHLLINRLMYLALPPFVHDGAPGRELFRAIHHRRHSYRRFRWCDDITHAGQASLREVYERGDTTHEFYRFAAAECVANPQTTARASRDRQLREDLQAFLAAAHCESRQDRRTWDPLPSRARTGLREARRNMAAALVRWHRSDDAGPRWRVQWQPLLTTVQAPRTARLVTQAEGLGLTQDAGELRGLFTLVASARPRRVLEVGNAHGGSLFLWTRAARRDGFLINLGVPLWELDDPREPHMRERLRGLAREAQTVRVLRQDPSHPDARSAVTETLSGTLIDFLFLTPDGNEDIEALYDAYAPLVRPAGLIAIQGIISSGFSSFWRNVCAGACAAEIVSRPPRPGFGIGVIRKA